MNVLNRFIALVLIAQLGLGPALAQIVDPTSFGNNNNNFNTGGVSGISNFKIVDQAADGSEVTLGFDYTYDGVAGPTAKIIAIIEKKGEKGISGWFGCDPAIVPKGSGPVSLRIRYFNDEFGVPPQFTSDRGRILFLNSSGISVVSSTPFIKTIKWGSPNAKPADKPSPVPVIIARGDTATARKIAEEKRLAEAKALQEAKAREEASRKAQAEVQLRKQLEERAMAEAKAREEARLKAEADAKRLAEERRVAEEKVRAEAELREKKRIAAEAEAKRLAEEKRVAELKAQQEAEQRELARLRDEAEAKAREEALLKAQAEAKAREEKRLKAEAEAKRLAEERRVAELKEKQEAEAREQARLKAEAEARAREEARIKAESDAKRLAEEKRLADEKAAREKAEAEKARLEAEARARDEARIKAEQAAKRLAEERRIAEAKAKKEAEEREQARLRAEAEAKAREEARIKAEAEKKRLAEEKRLAEVKAKQEAEMREQARLKAEAEAKAREEARLRAEAEAKAREELRLKAEADAKRLAEEKKAADEKALAEAKAREEMRIKAEAEAKRLADEKKAAEEKALAEAKARKEAEEKAYQEALEQAKAEAAAKKAAQEKAIAEAASAAPIVGTDAGPSLDIARGVKSKVTNVDVVNRSIDRTQMTIGVEYDYNKDDAGAKASMGVDVLRQADPSTANFFKGQTVEVGKSRRNFVLFPVKFQPPPGIGTDASGFSTDKVLVYLTNDSSKRLNLFAATMLLMWRAPGAATPAQVATATHTIDFDDFKQNDASDGYVAIRYNLIGGAGRLRVAVYDSANPSTRDYFATSQVEVTPGRGLQTLEVKVEPESKSPTDFIRADTIEIEMVDPSGKVLAKTSKKANMTWSKPRQ